MRTMMTTIAILILAAACAGGHDVYSGLMQITPSYLIDRHRCVLDSKAAKMGGGEGGPSWPTAAQKISSNFGSLPEDFQRGVSTRPEKFCLGSIMKNKPQFRSGRGAKRFGPQQKRLPNVLPTRSPALASTFSQTLALHQAGRLAEAEQNYLQILK